MSPWPGGPFRPWRFRRLFQKGFLQIQNLFFRPIPFDFRILRRWRKNSMSSNFEKFRLHI